MFIAPLKVASAGHRLDSVSRSAGDGLDRQGRIDAADDREDRAVADPEIAKVPASTIRIDDAGDWIMSHPRCAVQMTGVVILTPDVACIDGFERLCHEYDGVVDQARRYRTMS